MPDLTPVKVRGKRKATEAEKWHYGKQRKTTRSSPLAISRPTTDGLNSSSELLFRKRRKRHGPKLSRLEQLPTEILQSIFVSSSNLDLPLASLHLSSQLANPHLYHDLSDAVFELAFSHSLSEEKQDAMTGRLMNCRYFTWSYFQNWLAYRAQKSRKERAAHNVRDDTLEVDSDSKLKYDEMSWAWHALKGLSIHGNPNGVRPPVKLFRPPLTEENVRFFKFLINQDAELKDFPESYQSDVKDGLPAAIAAGDKSILEVYWRMGFEVETEHLKQAVIDAGCNTEVVRELVRHDVCGRTYPGDQIGRKNMDLLDPDIWAWAEKAEMRGDKKGKWLPEVLRLASREDVRSWDWHDDWKEMDTLGSSNSKDISI